MYLNASRGCVRACSILMVAHLLLVVRVCACMQHRKVRGCRANVRVNVTPLCECVSRCCARACTLHYFACVYCVAVCLSAYHADVSDVHAALMCALACCVHMRTVWSTCACVLR